MHLRRPRVAICVVALIAAAAAVAYAGTASGSGSSDPGRGRGPEGYTIGLFGDVPYGPQGRAEYPALLADVNGATLSFSIFDGDLKNGSDRCDNSLYTTSRDAFNTLERPVVWVPGDNDWTDCHRTSNGGYDPLERLALERQLFTRTGESLGKTRLSLTRESSEPQYALYSENVRWSYGPVVYVGLNVQGSNDNFPHAGVDGESRPAEEIAREDAEHVAREQANVHWLEESFAYAKSTGARGVLVAWQADPNFNNELNLADPRSYDGFTAILNALRLQTLAFAGQVVLVHGDSHYYRIDKPLLSPSGKVLANFTRVETFGSKNTHWVSATIDPENPNLFSFAPRLVPANVG